MFMKGQRLRVRSIAFNSLRNDLPEEEMNQLKGLCRCYHAKWWCYDRMSKSLRRKKWILNGLIGCFATTSIVSAIATHAIFLVGIAGASILIKSYMDISDLEIRLVSSKLAQQMYQNACSEIREVLRGASYDREEMIREFKIIDQHIANTAPAISDKVMEKYLRSHEPQVHKYS